MKKLLLAFMAVGLLSTAQAAKVESIFVPLEVQEHLNYITQNCEVRTHLTERIEQDKLGGNFVDPLRNVDRVVRSCDDGKFSNSVAIWNAYHSWFTYEINHYNLVPVFTWTEHQAGRFVRTGLFYWVKK